MILMITVASTNEDRQELAVELQDGTEPFKIGDLA
jgi:hypothetical protein